ncbi:hypothetical protein OEZ86_010952 [Tetradesmus obliquus]|nr:hypothetical protein OEZ86_010952 [Tetradesmus obliquus]
MALKQAKKLYEKRAYLQALAACRQVAPADRGADHQALVDEICMHSAATGKVIGFDGRVLQVQPADPATAWMGQQQQQQQQTPGTYASMADALAAAADGDIIQLLPGTHVTSQACLALDKRVLLEGLGGSPQEVMLDHRANHPAFNITRCCILRNLAIDMVGFCESISISSSSSCIKPILQKLHITCSGDDCLSIGGCAQPLLQQCTIQARRCGIKQYATSSTTLWSCSITGGSHGLVVCGSSQAFLEGCSITDCGQDGIVVLQQAGLHLSHSSVSGCQGPGVDVCDEGTASLKHADINGCCGGLWLWQSASCEAVSSYISGGSSYAVLLDQQAYARGSSTNIDGPCHDSSEAPLPLLPRPTAALHASGSAADRHSSSSGSSGSAAGFGARLAYAALYR